MHRQLRRGAIVSTSAAVLFGIAGIQAGIAQAAVDTPASSPALVSYQTAQPVSMPVVHAGLATPLTNSSALRAADSDDDNGESKHGEKDGESKHGKKTDSEKKDSEKKEQREPLIPNSLNRILPL